jgi:hypothetical protein
MEREAAMSASRFAFPFASEYWAYGMTPRANRQGAPISSQGIAAGKSARKRPSAISTVAARSIFDRVVREARRLKLHPRKAERRTQPSARSIRAAMKITIRRSIWVSSFPSRYPILLGKPQLATDFQGQSAAFARQEA